MKKKLLRDLKNRSIKGIYVKHPVTDETVKLMSSFAWKDAGYGFWYEKTDDIWKELLGTFYCETKEDVLNLEVVVDQNDSQLQKENKQ